MSIKTRKHVQQMLTPLDKAAACARVVLTAVHPRHADIDAAPVLAVVKALLGVQWTVRHAV